MALPKGKTYRLAYQDPNCIDENYEPDPVLDALVANIYIPEFDFGPKQETINGNIRITPGRHKGSMKQPEPYYIIFNEKSMEQKKERHLRILKFRAWDGEKMISPDYIDRKGVAHWTENGIHETSEIVMQSTNQTDDEGAELFEGDTVDMRIGLNRTNSKEKVEWIEYDMPGIIAYNNGIRACYCVLITKEGSTEGGMQPLWNDDCSRISLKKTGNVYENKTVNA